MAIPNGERKGRLGLAAEKEGKKGMAAWTADPEWRKEREAGAGGGEGKEKRMGGWGEIDSKTVWVVEGRETDNKGKGYLLSQMQNK